ncbi:DUF1307 domain-containing protein [Enterococcus caccae]|uniref:Lipoprotein n=1 Tax=Enterococcus caccae ATCC BAA-1240 TaxID=1158612 RepID=R3WNC2_9ENTE|nr:DUF1307 domain-containing protein [Enterococcus caccae]EOL49346.1 hypothetical protein UC7_00723 [Enterococcus caccae ATCC BAA-1240]EOT56398.1 hypothetical protein I580_03198 [Enterococcus caccae ATCC BAA-1240]OJG25297.1 hypothetical protein RU98_GL001122 [Enterococcus caccae]
MKKMGILASIIFGVLLFISACGSKNQTATYTLKQDDEMVTIQNIYNEDTILKQTVTTTIQYKTMGVKTKAKAEKLLQPSKELYAHKKGINYAIDFKDNKAVETIEIDFKKFSQSNAKMLPLISLPDGDLDSASEKQNADKLIHLGFEKND